ncbi:DUF3135 domain-containing protein [Uliginosibacterium sediminicola]|uniref:DUF3135 domain-containing protein n=1 Tax=Uliginosibacterium sediminicola TaxID=2024550 RepID=A0ABU9Z3M2_9RHOO
MPNTNFDFDHWSQLARRDPAAFFTAREKLIADFIAAAPAEHQASLMQMQLLIDATRAQAGTPMNAVKQMMGMIGDHLEAMGAQLEQLREESQQLSGLLGSVQQ